MPIWPEVAPIVPQRTPSKLPASESPNSRLNGEKSAGLEAGRMSRDSHEISKALFQLGMWKFDHFVVSYPACLWRQFATCGSQARDPGLSRIRPFLQTIDRFRERNRRKSPMRSAEIPVLQRLSAEAGSITTATRPRTQLRTVLSPRLHEIGNRSPELPTLPVPC